MNRRARMPGFYRYSIPDRLRLLYERELISEGDYHALMDDKLLLSREEADRLVENVIGVFGLPLGLGLNFVINGREYVVPMVMEEPSVLAGMSAAAKLARAGGGFFTDSDEPLLIGQIQVVDVAHPSRARAALMEHRQEIIDLANSLHPKMVARGGGAKGLEVIVHPLPTRRRDMVVVHLLVDTRDAMGANLVNTMCEGVASLVEKVSGGRVFLRILSNLADRAMVRAEARIPAAVLGGNGYTGEEVRDAVILASDFAAVDPYRATTHNKGVMNGIDAVAIATGNDWRAIEASAHAYAGRGHAYTSLTRWWCGEDGALAGRIELPLKVGIVGGHMAANPAVAFAQRLLGVATARELAEIMAAAGLAQNLAALRALSTEGIQRGHMTLHARSCAVAAGAAPETFDTVVERLIASGEIKVWKAKEILAGLADEPVRGTEYRLPTVDDAAYAAGHGKVILLGEHAAVYGSHAIAAPVPIAVQARVRDCDSGVKIMIPRWGVEEKLKGAPQTTVQRIVDLILRELGQRDRNMTIEAFPHLPRAMGLGGSASMAVATIRAVARFCALDITDDEVNRIAFGCEQIAHGTASGIDNTLATFGQFILFKKGDPPLIEPIAVPRPIPIVIGLSGVESLTAKTVATVRASWEGNPRLFDRVFAEIDTLTLEGVEAIKAYDLERLGQLMNVCQGLLNSLQVSTWELEELIGIARRAGALGAKLTGGGGGGSIVALCPEEKPEIGDRIAADMRAAGYSAIITEIG